jgi:hypothetical protein
MTRARRCARAAKVSILERPTRHAQNLTEHLGPRPQVTVSVGVYVVPEELADRASA